jgi:hypothetical protein
MLSFDPATKVAVYRRAADIVRAGWCQTAHALTAQGTFASWRNPKAVAFCMLAAILKATKEQIGDDEGDLVYGYAPFYENEAIRWNDAEGRTAAEVAVILEWKADEVIL